MTEGIVLIILCLQTGDDGLDQVRGRAVGEGAYDFLTKPVDMDELRLLLQRCEGC